MPAATSMPPWMLAALGTAAPVGQSYAQGGGAPGYYDLPGSRMLPGGNLAVSPGQAGQPRSMPGIDIPVAGDYVPNPGTTIDYSDSLGLYAQPRTIALGEMGGPGGGPAGQNIPLNDWFVPPNASDTWYPGEPNSDAAPSFIPPQEPTGSGITPPTNNGPPAAPLQYAGPGYTEPRSANSFIAGLINWNGPGAPNRHDPENSGSGALLARLMGLSRGKRGKSASGKWRGHNA